MHDDTQILPDVDSPLVIGSMFTGCIGSMTGSYRIYGQRCNCFEDGRFRSAKYPAEALAHSPWHGSIAVALTGGMSMSHGAT